MDRPTGRRVWCRILLFYVSLFCHGQGDEVSRCTNDMFDTLLCGPQTVIRITIVTASASISGGPAHCPFPHYDCSHVYAFDHEYYKRVQDACDGYRSCRYLWAESRTFIECDRQAHSAYVTIEYTCVPTAEPEQHIVRSTGEMFDTLMCPLGTVVEVTDAYVGVLQTPDHPSITAGDCVERLDPIQFSHDCDGRLTCADVTSRSQQLWCNYDVRVDSNYTAIFYTCVPDEDLRWSTKCAGSTFTDITRTLEHTYALTVVNVFVGMTSPAMCENGQYDVTNDCLLTLKSVEGISAYHELIADCSANCSALVSSEYDNLSCSEPQNDEVQYTLIAYKLIYADFFSRTCIGRQITDIDCDHDVIRITGVYYIHTDNGGTPNSECESHLSTGDECMYHINDTSEYYLDIFDKCSQQNNCSDIYAFPGAETYTDPGAPWHCRGDITEPQYVEISFQCVPETPQQLVTTDIPSTTKSVSWNNAAVTIETTEPSSETYTVEKTPDVVSMVTPVEPRKFTTKSNIGAIIAVSTVVLVGTIKLFTVCIH